MIKKIKVFDIVEDNMDEGIFAVSLVDYPAIESDFIMLQNEDLKLHMVDEEKYMIYGAALIPEKLILRIDKETGEEYYVKFPTSIMPKILCNLFKKGVQQSFTIQHEKTVEGLTICEAWIKESELDKSVHLGIQVPVGTIMLGVKVDNMDVWKEAKDQVIRGISIEGRFGIGREIFSSVDNSFEDWLNSVLSLPS